MEDTTTDNPQQKEEELFYFESDHLALRGNEDYSELLKTLFILTAQRQRAIKDYEKIQGIKRSALEDPETFLEKLKNDLLDIPPLQTLPQMPSINWYGYNTKISEDELKVIYNEKQSDKKELLDFGKHSGKTTHKKPWTPEEQKRLEELLVIYPPEPIELRRIKKIATALGNRTVQQVSSRLQKYFLKLHKAGLHVPGRIPKGTSFQKKHNKHKHGMWRPTTFFPEYNVSVYMDDTESVPGPSTQNSPKPSTSSDINYLLPMADYHQQEAMTEKSENLLQLELLKRIRAEKIKENEMTEPYRHLTYKCDNCNEEPILGTRWHCSTCIQDSIDFCTDCLLAQLYSDNVHPLTHKFVTLPHPDDPNFNMSSGSDSESANETSNNNEVSDSELSSYSNCSSLKSKQFSSPNGNTPPNREKNGLKTSPDDSQMHSFEVDKFLNELMYADEKEIDNYSTQDVGYSYLHSNLSMNDETHTGM